MVTNNQNPLNLKISKQEKRNFYLLNILNTFVIRSNFIITVEFESNNYEKTISNN